MTDRTKHVTPGVDLGYLLSELRKLSTRPQAAGNVAFWRVVRLHLRQKRGR